MQNGRSFLDYIRFPLLQHATIKYREDTRSLCGGYTLHQNALHTKCFESIFRSNLYYCKNIFCKTKGLPRLYIQLHRTKTWPTHETESSVSLMHQYIYEF